MTTMREQSLTLSILGHIHQLEKVFLENRDVLYGVQAGFLGPWGEWHGSNWGDPPSLQARRSVLFALLDAVPEPVTVHVRRPMFIRDIFAGEPGGPKSRHRPSTVGPGGRHRLAARRTADTRGCTRRPMAAGPATRGPLAETEHRRPVPDPPRQRWDHLRRSQGLERSGRGRGNQIAVTQLPSRRPRSGDNRCTPGNSVVSPDLNSNNLATYLVR